MMTIDKLEAKLDKISDTLRELQFSFHDAELGSEAETLRDEALDAITAYLELAVQDWEGRGENEEEEDTDR